MKNTSFSYKYEKMTEKKIFSRRRFIISSLFLSSQLILLSRLYYLQMVKGNKYKLLSDLNRTRTSVIYPLRGNILDRNMKVIANNKLCHSIIYDPSIPSDNKNILQDILSVIDISEQEKLAIQKNSSKTHKPIILIGNASWEDIIKVEINSSNLKGVYIEPYYKRSYPYASIISHLIGYVRNFYGGSKLFYNLSAREVIGSSGIEYIHEETLKGTQGFIQNEVNSHGVTVRELSKLDATSGNQIVLSIDIELQSYIYKLLNDLVIASGASAGVMNTRNGEILSMVNTPSYDNNTFTSIISDDLWKKSMQDIKKPMLNRFLSSRISPGSTFKLVIAIALLEENLISPEEEIECTGKVTVGDREYHCWKKTGHGKLNLYKAISCSCNVYIYQMIKRIKTIDSIHKIATELGLGKHCRHTRLKEENTGIVPNQQWIKDNNIPWYLGDRINLSIGQGYISITPMQMIIMTARIVSAKKINPVFLFNEKRSFEKLNISERTLSIIKQAMISVVSEPYGTARSFYSKNFVTGGKTGTVQNQNKDNHSIFTGFMESNNEQYVISVVLENNNVNSSVRATRIAKDISTYLSQIL
ncbi:penicillin-binding protein 2 [Anaplasmataceae bacterium AB001_6]|nr:penicillin-binding protein 2 [Anaplasmataceae bacterium AB001_6]